MPGITGLSGGQAPDRLDAMVRALVCAPHLQSLRLEGPTAAGPDPAAPPGLACQVLGRPRSAGVASRPDAALAVEGTVLDTERTGAALAEGLLDRFLLDGERFVEGLRGSFQIVAHRRGTTYLYADPLASRRLFYAHRHGELCFSPEVPPLMALLGRATVDPANLVQFLISGRFFAGGSALAPVRQLLPGEYLVHRRGRLERRSTCRYEIASEGGQADPEEAAEELERRLEEAIRCTWRRAPNPIFLLSGGYDSRFIFYSVARRVDDPSKLRTVIWGDRLDRPGSDTWIANRIARRFGTRHLEWPWGAEGVPDGFDGMFLAQSGMTDFVFTHVDELAHCLALHRDLGIESLLRGDEVFGPNGAEVGDVDEALARVGMSRVERMPEAARWFTHRGEEHLAAHTAHLEELLARAPANPADLRDTLYARERLPALQHQLSYHRAHHVETLNPLLDLGVIDFNRTLPASLRVGKRLFKEVFRRQFGHHLEAVPIASCGNGVDWADAIRHSPGLARFLRTGLEELPPPLDRTFFLRQLDSLVRGDPAQQCADRDRGSHHVPPERLVMRALILGRWLELWAG